MRAVSALTFTVGSFCSLATKTRSWTRYKESQSLPLPLEASNALKTTKGKVKND